MHLGFTGTHHGMTQAQNRALEALLAGLEDVASFHYGCCVGADAQFHAIALKLRSMQQSGEIHGYASNPPARYQFDGQCDMVDAPKPPLKRNRDIVNAADAMIATPAGMAEEQRSGTWATIRHARKSGKPLYIIWADGSVTWENELVL